MLYPNPFIGPGACAGGNGYCVTHDQPVLACENERLLSELVMINKRAETAEARVQALREDAQRIMREKGSYDVAIDPRVRREYERAYTFIQQLADPTPPTHGG